MRIEVTDVMWLEDHRLSLEELAELSGMPLSLLQELVDAGGIEALAGDLVGEPGETRYGARALTTARRARRLREDFELDTSALLLVLGLLDRVQELESHLQQLQARLPRRLL